MCTWTLGLLLYQRADLRRFGIIQGGHARLDLALQQLQGSATTCAAVRHLVLGAIFFAGCGSATATDDSDSASLGSRHDIVHHRLCACCKFAHFEHTHRPVPDDGLGLRDGLCILLARLWTTIQAHEPL